MKNFIFVKAFGPLLVVDGTMTKTFTELLTITGQSFNSIVNTYDRTDYEQTCRRVWHDAHSLSRILTADHDFDPIVDPLIKQMSLSC